MYRKGLRAKLHRGSVTGTDTAYEGSVTIAHKLLDASGIMVHEKVQVVNITNGNRFETYVIEGEPGEIRLNEAAARLAEVGGRVIVMAYGLFAEGETPNPTVIGLDQQNRVIADG